jgi:hypothetical protein
MNAVVETRATPLAVVQSESAALVAALERAAANPKVNIDKMRALMEMHREIAARQAETEYHVAMSACQAEMAPISADANNPQTSSKYASYPQMDRALRPIYTKHGFGLSFDEGESPKPDHIRLLCYVMHRAGHKVVHKIDLCADGKGAKGNAAMTLTHASGSAHTYGKRYLVKDIFNVAVYEPDDDGNGAGGKRGEEIDPRDNAARVKAGYISHEEIAELRALMTKLKTDEAGFLKYMHVQQVADIPKIQLKTAIRAIHSSAKAHAQAPKSAGGNGRCTPPQVSMLREKLDKSGVPENEFLRRFGIDEIEELSFANVDTAVQWIDKVVSG